MDWVNILASAGLTAPLLFAAAWYLTKRLVEKRFNQDLESHKAELTKQVEEEKAQLALANATQLQATKTAAGILLEDLRSSRRRAEAHLTKLDERRANVLAETYARIVRTAIEMRDVLRPKQAMEGKNPAAAARARMALLELQRYFAEHEIFFHTGTAGAIGKWLHATERVLCELEKPIEENAYKTIVSRLEAASFGYGELRNIQALIVRDMRSLLGVHAGPLGDAAEAGGSEKVDGSGDHAGPTADHVAGTA